LQDRSKSKGHSGQSCQRVRHSLPLLVARVPPEAGPTCKHGVAHVASLSPPGPWRYVAKSVAVLEQFSEARQSEGLRVSSNGDVNPKGPTPLTGGSAPDAWPWPDDLDAMIAAPGFHAVLFEDNRVRVLDGRVPPGATVPVHTHRWGGVLYILATSDFVRRDPDGNVLADTRALKSTPISGTAGWGAPLTPHSLENVGSEEFRTLTVEMKDGYGNATP